MKGEREIWFTRATLRMGASDVGPLLNSLFRDDGEGGRLNNTHRLLWTLMPEDLQRAKQPVHAASKAAFLWRDAPERHGASTWYVLGPRPRSQSAFFEIEAKPWSPALTQGDRLAFDIKVNATVNRMIYPSQGREGRKRVDVVMDAIHAAERTEEGRASRAVLRGSLAEPSLKAWWETQATRNGFRAISLSVMNYAVVPLQGRRSSASVRAQIGVSHLTGTLEVLDPDMFSNRVVDGFGRAKAFGCGLLLLRRS